MAPIAPNVQVVQVSTMIAPECQSGRDYELPAWPYVDQCFKIVSIFIFDNPEGQWAMWATYLHTRAMFNIWHWQR